MRATPGIVWQCQPTCSPTPWTNLIGAPWPTSHPQSLTHSTAYTIDHCQQLSVLKIVLKSRGTFCAQVNEV